MLKPFLACWLYALLLAQSALGGTSASQWIVVVNGQSQNSLTLANHYCVLRDIPARNVVILKDIPNANSISIDEFRKLILAPVIEQIEARQLTNHIQGIAGAQVWCCPPSTSTPTTP